MANFRVFCCSRVLLATLLFSLRASAAPVFDPGGNATLTFDSDNGGAGNQHQTVNVDLQNPPAAPQLNEYVAGLGGGFASGQASLFAYTGGAEFGINAPEETGVSQFNPVAANDFANATTLTLSWSATWTIQGSQLGPPVYGVGNAWLDGVVSGGAGSFVSFDFDGQFTGAVTRSPISFHYYNDTPGSFNVDFHSFEYTVPDTIEVGEMETLSGVVTFQAHGVDGLSEIRFSQPFSTVPEPSQYALLAGLCLFGFACGRRRTRLSRQIQVD